jgi:hypothetical protein
MAPPGFAFKTLTVFADTGPHNTGHLSVGIGMEDTAGEIVRQTASLSTARGEGLRMTSLPRCGWFVFRAEYEGTELLEGLRLVPTWEALDGPHGSLDVQCSTTPSFLVTVNGRPGRVGPGPIGLITPGECLLEFMPVSGRKDFIPWRTTVHVNAEEVTPVLGQLTAAKNWPLANWGSPVLVGRQYDAVPVYWDHSSGLYIMADDSAIRLVWSHFGDIWSSMSTDGQTFSRPVRFELPVSSGWVEDQPECWQDESRRFLLSFRSDRDAQHQNAYYGCWSRDFANWSRPERITEGTAGFRAPRRVLPGYAWFLPADPKMRYRDRVHRRGDGRLEAFRITAKEDFAVACQPAVLLRALSDNHGPCSEPQVLADFVAVRSLGGLFAFHHDGRSIVILTKDDPRTGKSYIAAVEETADGGWRKSPWRETPYAFHDMVYHPKWGYIAAWTHRSGWEPKHGPYVIRGPNFEGLLNARSDPDVLATEAADRYAIARLLEEQAEPDRAREEYCKVLQLLPDGPAATEAKNRLNALATQPTEEKP